MDRFCYFFVFVCVVSIMEEWLGGYGGVMSISFKVLRRLGNDQPLLSLFKGLLRHIKGLSFKALVRYYSSWIAELPYPVLIQMAGSCGWIMYVYMYICIYTL